MGIPPPPPLLALYCYTKKGASHWQRQRVLLGLLKEEDGLVIATESFRQYEKSRISVIYVFFSLLYQEK